MDLFYFDISQNRLVQWEELVADLKKAKKYNPFCYHKDYYNVFKHIVMSLLLEEEIILLDSGFSSEEVKELTSFENLHGFEKIICTNKYPKISTKEELINRIKLVGEKWSITLFTSGTTGLPKKVKHSFSSITRNVKSGIQTEKKVWGFAYNPTHMAGIQVFFQALLNGNPIIRLFGLETDLIIKSLKTKKVTHISATPTFYRLLAASDERFTDVIRATSGGEKLEEQAIKRLKTSFPNAKITNVYASTEAGALFASEGDVFSIKPEMEEYIKVQNQELLIHKSIMGITGFMEEWYNTGDIIKILSEDPLQFQFIFRKNEMINVGGYKVNPAEVEDTIRNIPGVMDVRVFPKKNSVLGNIVCCEVIRSDQNINEFIIREFLQKTLQEYKIPRFVKFVDKLSTTRTGKIKRD